MIPSPALIARLTDSFPPELPPVPVLRKICAWCVDFDPTKPENKGATHILCSRCAIKFASSTHRRQTRT